MVCLYVDVTYNARCVASCVVPCAPFAVNTECVQTGQLMHEIRHSPAAYVRNNMVHPLLCTILCVARFEIASSNTCSLGCH